jgi:hypothetical protein
MMKILQTWGSREDICLWFWRDVFDAMKNAIYAACYRSVRPYKPGADGGTGHTLVMAGAHSRSVLRQGLCQGVGRLASIQRYKGTRTTVIIIVVVIMVVVIMVIVVVV